MLSICICIPISTNWFFYTSLISNSKLVILHCFLLFVDLFFLYFFYSTPYSFYLFLPSPFSYFYFFLPFSTCRQARWRRRPKFLGTTATQTEESTYSPVNLNLASWSKRVIFHIKWLFSHCIGFLLIALDVQLSFFLG